MESNPALDYNDGMRFDLQAPYKPTDDQPQAIADWLKVCVKAIAIRFCWCDGYGQDFHGGDHPAAATAYPRIMHTKPRGQLYE